MQIRTLAIHNTLPLLVCLDTAVIKISEEIFNSH